MSSLPSCFFIFALDKCHYITGAREFSVEHIDDTKTGELILTTSEVQM